MVESNKKVSGSLKEAEKIFKEANGSIKTGLFKWSPDYLEGATQFERAAKLFKQHGVKDKAITAFLKYSLCSEKINAFYGAAEGLTEAAFLESDKKQSLVYLKKAQEFYKIQGTDNTGQNQLKRFGQKLLESEDPVSKEFALKVYSDLFDEVFEGENYMWNPEIIPEYVQLLIKEKEYLKAIEAKKKLIKYLKSQNQIDHQIRRAYVEIICIQIIAEDYYRIQDTLDTFNNDFDGNAYKYDEFKMANELKEISGSKDYKQLEALLKKPLFGFLDNEIIRTLKLTAMDNSQGGQFKSGPGAGIGAIQMQSVGKDNKKKAIDNLML